jgi:putative phosphoribosyl transferase
VARQLGASLVLVAAPVGSRDAVRALRATHGVDEVVCLLTPPDFNAVGAYYRDFSATTEDEVEELIARAAARLGRTRHHDTRTA